MKTKDYTTSFIVDQSPEEVFNAINNVRGWWSEEIEGDTDRLGTEFRFHHKDLHRSTQNITELQPGKKVVWHVVDGQINFVKNKTEWDGTDIVFDIACKGDKTELRFTHRGFGACDRVLRRLLGRMGFLCQREPAEPDYYRPGRSSAERVSGPLGPGCAREWIWKTPESSKPDISHFWKLSAPFGRGFTDIARG